MSSEYLQINLTVLTCTVITNTCEELLASGKYSRANPVMQTTISGHLDLHQLALSKLKSCLVKFNSLELGLGDIGI